MRKFTVAAIQMDSQNDKAQNLKEAIIFLEEAVKKGAMLISFPEQMNYIGKDIKNNTENLTDGETFKLLSQQAKKHKVWIHGGSIYEKDEDNKLYNSTMFINPNGELEARYRKIHMADLEVNGINILESKYVLPGNELVTFDTKEVGVLGLSICYDVRFGEMYRKMALAGAQIFFVPQAFTMKTGTEHLDVLLRAISIENGCYTISSGQIGIKPKYEAPGRTMIIDPWGNIIASAPDKPCVITAEVNLDFLESVRKQLGVFHNRRNDLYR